ncbi:LysR family transcriptional regulator [Allorhizobium sp. BGMRC 0089]|uniref:LysR family transcriptional regulator n=1 Tax=Allorhizobium sonneratiae TaxID=2934936 RepID=UPI0020342037|nr:LysR family transcriptional regulator [Allorhizobium sonneratiae]MCM2293069.1 LysR family transcriptional regulator [Allorhizobium sonneratiae]
MALTKPLAWEDLQLVKAVAQARGMSGAAAELGIDHSTVFRRLGALETALGQPLFERRRSGYTLTATGEEVVGTARRIDQDVMALERRLKGQEILPAGEIRIATADSLLMHLLTPLFARFRKACPDIQLDLVIGNPALNLSRRDADIAIRATDKPPETLVGRKIGQIAWALYGRARDFAEIGPKSDAASLTTHDWVALSDDMAALNVVRSAISTIARNRLVYRANSVLALAEAIEAGIGIGHIPCFIGDVRPGLVRLSDTVPDFTATLWLLTHPDLRHSPRIRALMDFLATELTPLKDLIAGNTADVGLI